MIKFCESGRMITISRPQVTGEEWLQRIKSILRLVQNVDKNQVSNQDIYYAIDVVNDMLPDESDANTISETMKKSKKEIAEYKEVYY